MNLKNLNKTIKINKLSNKHKEHNKELGILLTLERLLIFLIRNNKNLQ